MFSERPSFYGSFLFLIPTLLFFISSICSASSTSGLVNSAQLRPVTGENGVFFLFFFFVDFFFVVLYICMVVVCSVEGERVLFCEDDIVFVVYYD